MRQLLRQPLFVLAAGYVLLLCVLGVLAPLIAPYPPGAQDLANTLGGPSSEHFLGTDTLGRDVLSRLLFGIAPTLIGTAQAVAVFVAIGVPLGLIAGFRGGRTDTAVMRIAELVMSVPPIVVVLVVLVVFDGNPTAAAVCLGALGAPGLIRVVRAAAASVTQNLFVTAARVAGVRPTIILRTHILRGVRGPIIVQVSLFAGIALGFQAVLGFLGLLSDGDTPTWGGGVAEAAGVITQSMWLLIPPGLAITLTVVAFGLLGDIARDLSADSTSPTPSARTTHDPTPPAPREDTDLHLLGEEDSTALLSVRGLTVTDSAGTALITDVSFAVRPGETVGLVGESGCGKSVTALAALGLLPPNLTSTARSIDFDGTELLTPGLDAYRGLRGSALAYISQDPMAALDPTHDVRSHLDEIIARHDRSATKSARRQRAIELLHQVKIDDTERVLRSHAHEISGGMAQRIAIAIALAGRPRLLIADEPTTALDVTVQAEILALLRELTSTTGLSLLLITHDWGVVADICDRAAVMYAGQIVEHAPVDAVFTTPLHPYTEALLGADLTRSVDDRRLPTLPGRVPAPQNWPTGCRFSARCHYAQPACSAGPVPMVTTGAQSASRCLRIDALRHRTEDAS